ncbi:MAG: histidine kinase [Spartobacteria bacterium]|nr:histidine kinase [Spartobacteria bacterium]
MMKTRLSTPAPVVIALGEVLIDFVALQSGVSLLEAGSFKKAAGGAPANVAVGLARMGIPCGFVGRVGSDPFGEFLAQTLQENGVDTSGISYDEKARTMLAFVSLTAGGERDFMFYRHPSADMLLSPEHINEALIRDAAIFHFGSISLSVEPCRDATLYALSIAKKHGRFVSYDPNLRPALWDSLDHAKREIMSAIPYADFMKINDDELEFLTGSKDLESGIKQFLDMGPSIVAVTLGPKGTCIATRSNMLTIPVVDVPVVDTTGAGDTFVAGFLSGLLPHIQNQTAGDLTPDDLMRITAYANTAAAITTMGRGAIPSMPTAEQIDELLNKSL